MQTEDVSRLHAMATVILRVGVNLQPGQPLLITEPYELQGVHPEAGPLVDAITAGATGNPVSVIPADLAGLRGLVEANNLRGYEALVSRHCRRMEQHLSRGGAFLFLQGSQPQLMAGQPAERLASFDRVKWRHLGPLIQRLVRGATQWTLAPAPSSNWADAVYADLPAADRLPALWRTVFEAMRVTPAAGAALRRDSKILSEYSAPATTDPISAWHAHLVTLARRRDVLNAARRRRIRYLGLGTDLTLDLPSSHVWCTAQLVSQTGVPFVANLPTEEIFTAPHKSSARGSVRVVRPVILGGTVIDGIELEFLRGRVATAKARTGQDALEHLLATDRGAGRIGEVAVLPAYMEGPTPRRPGPDTWQSSGRLFHQTLLDENAAHHIALGAAYRFCSRALLPLALNHSEVHLDLPLAATVSLE